jgi:hypothetical protein
MPPIDPSISTPIPGGLVPESSPLTGTVSEPAPIVPDITAGQPQSNFVPNIATQPAPVNPARPWANILQGALWGLSGAAQKGPGRGGFLAGVGMGASAAQQMKFASTKAADDHIRAMKEAQLADLQTEEGKLSLQMQYQNIAALNKLFNLKPDGSISGANPQDMHSQAVGAHQVMAAASPDGSTLPRVQTVSSPIGHGDDTKNHVIDYYNPPSAQDLQQNPTGYHDFVNEAFKADGKVLTDQMWQTANGAVKPGEKPNAISMLAQQQEGQAQMVQNAYQALYSPFGGKEVDTKGARSPEQITSMNAGTAAYLQQRADAYDKLQDANSTVSKLLHGQVTNFNNEVERQRSLATTAKSSTATSLSPAEAAAAGQKKADELAAEYDPNTKAGQLNIQKAQQDLLDKKTGNLEKAQKQLFEIGIAPDPTDPTKQVKLNLSTSGAEEMLVDQHTGQPIPTKNVAAIKPSMQEQNRGDFAKSALHVLDVIDKLRSQGKVPNGPITGVTAKELGKIGVAGDSQEALDLIGFASSAATGAHVGGRFNQEIMKKMDTMLAMNMNDPSFNAAERAIREVMTPYATNGGRQSVTDFKQSLMGTSKIKNGKTYTINGFDQNGLPIYDVK